MNHNIQTLTGLRGLAALIVFISHSANQSLLPSYFGNGFGKIGVMIFFVLSGFLMGYLYLNQTFNRCNIQAFVFARIGRVFPLYITLIILSYIITTYLYSGFHYRIDNLFTFIKAISFIRAPHEFWTIPVEVQFYVFYIAVWYFFSKSRNYKSIIYLWAFSLLPTLTYWMLSGKIPTLFSTYSSSFMVGILFSCIFNYANESIMLKRFANISGFLFLILLFVNLPSLRLDYNLVLSRDLFTRTWLGPINWTIILGLFFCAIMDSKSLFFLKTKPFLYLGKVSYALYLLHYPVLLIVKSLSIPEYVKAGTALLITILLSQISNYLLENPANKLIRDLGRPEKPHSNE